MQGKGKSVWGQIGPLILYKTFTSLANSTFQLGNWFSSIDMTHFTLKSVEIILP